MKPPRIYGEHLDLLTAQLPVYSGGDVVAFTLIDADLLPDVGRFRWHLKEDYGYVVRMSQTGGRNGPQVKYRLHRVVMGAKHGDGREIDHINRDKLDNRRSNLRFCTHVENMANSLRWVKAV